MFVMQKHKGFTLLASLMILIIFVFLGKMLIQISQSQWQDIVFTHQYLQKENLERSAINWTNAYVKKNKACFPTQMINFNYPDKRSYGIEVSCQPT